MRRVVSAWFPSWPIDRLRRKPGAPLSDEGVVVAGKVGSRRLVMAADAAARACGIRRGMTVALAQATVPGLTIIEADATGDAAALERLAVWALRYTPIAAPDPTDGLVIDVTGAAHLRGGEAALLTEMTARFEATGITARLGLADSWGAAWGLARYAPGTIAPPGGGIASIAALPIEALRLSSDTVQALRQLGFESVADLATAPRASLGLRFGPSLLSRLDAAAGRQRDTIVAALPPSIPQARLAFAEPLGHLGGLTLAPRKLAEELCALLTLAGLGARRLDLHVHRVDAQVATLRVGAVRATRDVAHIVRLFRDKLETIDPGFGVETAVLAATRTEPMPAPQVSSLDAEEDHADLAPLIDRIAGRIGSRHVYRLAPAESDVPERALRLLPALAPSCGTSWSDGPRPQRLFEKPESVEVMALLPDYPPAAYVWNGTRRRVVSADGPESVAGEWWLAESEIFLTRDYFRVESEDGFRAWLFRATRPGAMRWFIHGVFA